MQREKEERGERGRGKEDIQTKIQIEKEKKKYTDRARASERLKNLKTGAGASRPYTLVLKTSLLSYCES